MPVLSILDSVSQPQGLPIKKSFTVPEGFPNQNLLLVSGSAFTSQNGIQLTVQVLIGENVVGQLFFEAYTPNTHQAFAPVFLATNLLPAEYTLTLQVPPKAATETDENDWFSAALIG
ncbi:MAG TPA: hypothetical protein VF100_04520 [Thermoanaerobaculia bacterium]